MKIEKTKPKKGITELPLVTKELILKLQTCSDLELVNILQNTTVWRFGKCELYYWIDVLDRFDVILEEASKDEQDSPTECIFMCPKLMEPQFKEKVVTVLNFTSLLIEHSYARHIYNSTEHLCVLLACPDLDVVLAVLNLLYVFSKRSNFISRLPPKQRANLNSYLEYLGETWGGKQNGFGLAQCCQKEPQTFPDSCTTVYFEYHPTDAKQDLQVGSLRLGLGTESIVLENVDKLPESTPELMASIAAKHQIPAVKQMQLLMRLRLARNFLDYQQRLKCVMARLQAISILADSHQLLRKKVVPSSPCETSLWLGVYSVAPAEIVDPLIYDGFVDELVELLEIKDNKIMAIRAAVLRTLTAIIHLERDPRLGSIIEATGASAYHGFLPSLVRDCVASFITTDSTESVNDFPLSFATALFSFLYHLATYEASGDALVSSGIMESLLQVLEWRAFEPTNITLVTRAVRVIDLITNLDMSAFHSLGGWDKMLARLEMEWKQCAQEVPTILPEKVKPVLDQRGAEQEEQAPDKERSVEEEETVPMDTSGVVVPQPERDSPTDVGADMDDGDSVTRRGPHPQCMPERAALIKSILNFLKKAIPDATFAENIRILVDSSLPQSLKHIVSNAEYYGPSIYLPATEVTTVFIFHEPSQLSPLQDNGLPWVVLNSIINKKIPVTREVLASLPNILSALCLNARGLQVFINAKPFDHLFGVLISPDYLPAMRKKKGADQIGDTASNLGIAMDELMRHQPTLRSNVISALIKLLNKLVDMGTTIRNTPEENTPGDKSTASASEASKHKLLGVAGENRMNSDSENEDEDEDDDGEGSHSSEEEKGEGGEERQEGEGGDEQRSDRGPPPLSEYVINVVHFVDAILSNNSTDDHIQEFIVQGGLTPLLRLLSLPALPLDFPTSSACSAITSTCRGILNIARAPELLQDGLGQLSSLLDDLSPFLESPQHAHNSVLLQEIGPLSCMADAIKSPLVTPLLHKLIAVNGFIQLFIHLSRASQVGYNIESRALCVHQWASTLGKSVLVKLSELYRALVWEGFILLAVAANKDKAHKEEGTVKSSSQTTENKSDSHSTTTPPLDSVPVSLESHTQSIGPESTDTSSTSSSSVVESHSQAPSQTVATESMDTGTSGSQGQNQDLKTTGASAVSSKPGGNSDSTPSILVQSLKQLTPLLAITSRVGRSLAELMSLLVRISTSPLHRPHRRGPGHSFLMHSYHPPSDEAIAVCMEVTNLLVNSLNWEVPRPHACSAAMQSPISDWLFAGMTFKMYAVDFCELLLFDEHKQAYHMVQYAFDKKAALQAFISTFETAIKTVNSSNETGSVYGSCVDFLEAWLNLAEKLVNASAVLDSSHALSIPPPSQAGGKKLLFNPIFNPLTFVIEAQKAVLPCLQELWGSPQLTNLSPKVVELLISTVRHFYSSEKVIRAKLAELNAGSEPKPSSSQGGSVPPAVPPPVAAPRVDPLYLQQLCDMGFSREHSEEALLACGNDINTAMEWILSHPPSSVVAEVDMEMSEEEQIMRAIALSLGNNVNKEEEEEKKEEPKKEEEKDDLSPVNKVLLDEFSDTLLPGCIELASSVSDSVYRVCDLLSALAKRNGKEWRSRALERVRNKVLLSVKGLIDQIESGSYTIQQDAQIDPVACLIHLLALLMEEMPLACAQMMCEPELLSCCVQLLHVAQSRVCNLITADTRTPRWLGPLLLLLDLWEKTVLLTKWQRPLPKEDVHVVWHWFENSRWCSYSSENSQQIEQAYQENENSVKISSGRQRYVVQFGPMIQANMETSTQRPVLRLEIPKKGKNGAEKSKAPTPTSQMEGACSVSAEQLYTFTEEQANTTIRCCTNLLSAHLNPDTLHANMRLCLRLTRRPELASIFNKEGGPQALLSLTHKSAFRGFTSLAALLFRHCLEEGPLLQQAMESMVRSVVNSPSGTSKEGRPQGLVSRELHYVLRRLGPCACRNPELLTETACSVLRMSTQPPKPENYVHSQRVPPTVLKCAGPPKMETVPLNNMQINLINLLIDHLCAESEDPSSKGGNGEGMKMEEDTQSEDVRRPLFRIAPAGQGRRMRHASYRRQLTGNFDIDDDVVSEDMTVDTEPEVRSAAPPSETTAEGSSTAKNDKDKLTEKPLLSKAAVLRLLAELVESYPSCARMIAESSRKIKVDASPAKEMTVLAFVFDHLLPASTNQTNSQSAVTKLAKTFLQCLATAHCCPDAISGLVTEFKMAFARALALQESQAKHSRVRALMGLLSQILEYVTTSRGPVNPSHFARLLIRKGFISDLTKAIHSLNLSSTFLPATINNILKPLEVLTRIVNQVASSQQRKMDSESKSTSNSRPVTAVSQGSRPENEPSTSQPQAAPPTLAEGSLTMTTSAAPTTNRDSDQGTLEATDDSHPAASSSQSAPVDESILEATHESLIPLEEEEEVEEGGDTAGMHQGTMDADLIGQAVSLARELGRQTQGFLREASGEGDVDIQELVGEFLEREPGGVGVHPEALLGEVMMHSSSDHHTDSEESGDESISESEEEEEEEVEVEEDNCNSAGEEFEEDEFDDSHVEGVLAVGEDDIGSDLSDAESTQDDTEVEATEEDEEEEEEESGGSVATSVEREEEEGEESMVLEGDGGEGEDHEDGGERMYDPEGEEEEEEDEDEEEEEGEEDELDLEYDYDDDDDEDTDYLHVDMPWGWREPDMELHIHPPGGFSSLLSRAYHMRPPHHLSDYDHASSNSAHSLPPYHPLLVRHADHPQHQQSRTVGSSSVHFDPSTVTPDGQHETSAIQQLLTNISAAAGTDEVLSFGVGSSGTQRTRGTQNAQSQTADDGSESTVIPNTQARWEEESHALDGQAAHTCISILRDKITQVLTQIYEQENAPKEPPTPRPPPVSSASAQASGSGSSSTLRTSDSGVQGGSTGGETNRGLPVVPHPSDQVTPSDPSPRDSASTVDQLRSSLRQVADALAQTVATVRNARERMGRGSSESTAEGGREEEAESGNRDHSSAAGEHHDARTESQFQDISDTEWTTQEETAGMETSELPLVHVTLPPQPTSPPFPPPQDTSSPSPIPTTSSTTTLTASHTSAVTVTTTTPSLTASSTTPSNPIMATFDGSQESAVATLANTNPEDPLYTFLSAVAGAPAPPLPETSPSLSPTVQQTTQTVVPSPRLPVFTQFQSSSGSTAPSETVELSHSHSTAIPMSVIQDARTSTVSAPPCTTSESTSTTESQPLSLQAAGTLVPPSDSSAVDAVDVDALAANIVSQVTTLQQNLDSHATSDTASSLVHVSSIADSLAQELVRAVSQLVPTSSSDDQTVPSVATTCTLATTTNTQTLQSPSPSDTLAPLLISSLQMPPSGANQTEPSPEQDAEQQQGGAPSDQEQLVTVETGTRDETTGEEISAMQTEGGEITERTSGQSTSAGAETSQSSSAAAGGGEASMLSQDVIDPTFLAALPDPIRIEVLAQHEREQQLRRVQRESGAPSDISADFLAALPPNIQDEVIQQERTERAQQQAQTSNPTDPLDNASFFRNLPAELRRNILSDVDDSLIGHLPEDIAVEARQLRQDRDSRRRQLLEQRHAFLEQMIEDARLRGEGGIGGIPPPMWSHNVDAGYQYILNMNPNHIMEGHLGGRLGFRHHHHRHHLGALTASLTRMGEQSSKQMLDQEALTCLLVLLFLDQNKLHNNRLHRIVKNLSQHLPTRAWILSSLLAILRETSCSVALPPQLRSTCPMPPPLTPGKQPNHGESSLATSTPTASHFTTPHWLNISISAALGSHARVFQFEHSGKIGTNAKIQVHPLAGISVCSNVLDLIVFLARQFPTSFIPSQLVPKDAGKDKSAFSTSEDKEEASEVISSFWHILLKLDGAASRKGKGSLKTFQYSVPNSGRTDCETFSSSIIGQLMLLFQQDVVKGSITLTDKLLKALSIASSAIPKSGLVRTKQDKQDKQVLGEGTSKPLETSTQNLVAVASESEDVFVEQPQSLVTSLLLKIIVGVLTSGRCSEDGLDDATNLLTNLSRCSVTTRETILMMLLDGVKTIGQTLCSQIYTLLEDLTVNMPSLTLQRQSSIPTSDDHMPAAVTTSTRPAPSGPNVLQGIVLPSARQNQHVNHSHDLHIPSMVPLMCKGSQQSFFLRMLKVVCQLRESAQAAFLSQTKTLSLVSLAGYTSGYDDSSTGASALGEGDLQPQPLPLPPQAASSTATQPERPMEQGGERGSPQPQPQSQSVQEQSGSSSTSQAQTQAQSGSNSSAHVQDRAKPQDSDHQAQFLLQSLSQQLELEDLWSSLSACLNALADTNDPHAVLVLQPTVEAFFLVHAGSTEDSKPLSKRTRSSQSRIGRLSSFHTISDTESNPASPAPHLDFSPMPATPGPGDSEQDPYAHLPPDTARFLKFAENHRTVLNQILRQSTIPLAEGPFAVLVNHTRILDFDIKRRYFRQELEQLDDGLRRDDIILHLRRDHVFEDSFRELYRRPPEDLKGNLYIQFEGEEGQDAGGLLREWYLIIAREMFDPNYALFRTTPGDKVTYMPNPSSNVNPNHLNYFKFIGRVIAKAIYDNKLLDCYFTRSFYKHILGKPVHYTDMEAEDYAFYQGMVFLLEHDLNEIGSELAFSIDIQEFGKMETKDLKPNGANIPVTESNKREYVQLACQMKMTGSIRSQIKSFLEGFYDVIPKELISIFNEQELELLISGLPTIDIDDLKSYTEYHKYMEHSLQIQWFWRALRSFDQADRARFLQFVTGTSKVPLQGFAALEGMNGIQNFQIHRDDRSTDRLPCAHTCFNQLDLPAYETYDKLCSMLLTAIRECPEGFGLA